MTISGKPKTKELIKAWDDLTEQWEKHTGKMIISTEYAKSTNDIKKSNRILGLVSAYYLLDLGQKEGVFFANYHGVSVKEATKEEAAKVKLKLQQLDTQMRLQEIGKAANHVEHEETTFEGLIAMLEESLGRNVDPEMNCLRWIELNKLAEKKQRNGRNNQSGRVNSVR